MLTLAGILDGFRNASHDEQPWPALKLPGESSAGLSPTEADSGHADKSSPNTFPGMNLIVLLASILTCARVIGVTSLQAFRTAILEVPNPSNLTLLVSLTPCLTCFDYGGAKVCTRLCPAAD